jgi:hypothetical protein
MCNFLDLLNSIEIQGLIQLNSDEDLHAFEDASGFRLPSEFKDYCKVFGGGFFGATGVTIDFITIPEIVSILLNEQAQRESILSTVEYLAEDQSPSELVRLINHSYNFGYSYSNAWFLWDLESYSQKDKSYDIYIVKGITTDEVRFHKLGRNFCEFIRDYAMGRNPDQNFLELLWLNTDEQGHISLDDPTFFEQGNYFGGSGLEA